MRTALYAGSFDPVHRGHLSIIDAASELFDVVVVAVMGNPDKPSGLLSIPLRVRLIEQSVANHARVRVISHHGLTVDAARDVHADVLIRSAHKETTSERSMAHTNRRVGGLQTAFLLGDAETEWISSSLVRDLLARGRIESIRPLVSAPVFAALVIETDRLLLRAITMDDVDLLVSLDSDPEVMRYLSGGEAPTRADVEPIVRSSIGHRWVGFERVTGAFVGWFGIYPSVEGELELGYRLRREMWGRGLATEGSRALIDVAFRERGARRVFAQTMAVNARSRAVMERCGLSYARTFHLDFDDPIEGTELGEVEYEIFPPD